MSGYPNDPTRQDQPNQQPAQGQPVPPFPAQNMPVNHAVPPQVSGYYPPQNGRVVPPGYLPYNYHKKSKLAAALLAFSVGTFGVHNFYLGFNNKATVQLVLAILGIVANIFLLFIPLIVAAVWSFVEGIQIIGNHEQYRFDGNGMEMRE